MADITERLERIERAVTDGHGTGDEKMALDQKRQGAHAAVVGLAVADQSYAATNARADRGQSAPEPPLCAGCDDAPQELAVARNWLFRSQCRERPGW
jgi:hypothetical protein